MPQKPIRAPSLIALPVLALLVVGCMTTDEGGVPTDWVFDNRTDDVLTVVWEREFGERVELIELPAGKKFWIHVNDYGNPRQACDDGELVALGSGGQEVAPPPNNLRSMGPRAVIIAVSGQPVRSLASVGVHRTHHSHEQRDEGAAAVPVIEPSWETRGGVTSGRSSILLASVVRAILVKCGAPPKPGQRR